jgi:hypothetical protein
MAIGGEEFPVGGTGFSREAFISFNSDTILSQK